MSGMSDVVGLAHVEDYYRSGDARDLMKTISYCYCWLNDWFHGHRLPALNVHLNFGSLEFQKSRR